MNNLNEANYDSELWKNRLTSWVQEWDLRNKFLDDQRAEEEGKVISEKLNSYKCVTQCNEPIEVGDIRILRSRVVGETQLPVYVAVISKWENGDWLIAPYGEFSEPATSGELLTGRSDFGLRVLCLWNTHSISSGDLRFSFIEDQMTVDEIKDAWKVFRSVSTGEDLPENLSLRVGSPIINPKDPRIVYQQEFRELMAPIRDLWALPKVLEFPIELISQHKSKARGEYLNYALEEFAAAKPSDFLGNEPIYYVFENIGIEIALKKHPRGLSLNIFEKVTGYTAEQFHGIKIKNQNLETISIFERGVSVIKAEMLTDSTFFEFIIEGERIRFKSVDQ